jgi:hypothetical protein
VTGLVAFQAMNAAKQSDMTSEKKLKIQYSTDSSLNGIRLALPNIVPQAATIPKMHQNARFETRAQSLHRGTISVGV